MRRGPCARRAVAQEVQDYLKTICSDLHVTRGEFDESSYPETKARPARPWRASQPSVRAAPLTPPPRRAR